MIGVPLEGRVRIDAIQISIPKLIELISADVRRIIVDNTGFTEKFDLHLEFASDEVIGDGLRPVPLGYPGITAVSDNLSGVSIFTALQQQLGLYLKSIKLPVEMLVIDHVERPSEN